MHLCEAFSSCPSRLRFTDLLPQSRNSLDRKLSLSTMHGDEDAGLYSRQVSGGLFRCLLVLDLCV